MDKNLKKNPSLKNYTQPYTREDTQQHLINNCLKLAEKIPQRELRNLKKHNNKKPVAYVAAYNKNNPELFTEIMKDLDELKNRDKIKEILDTTKIIKSQRQPKNPKRIPSSSTFEKNATQGVTKCKNKRCKICDIIIEGKSYIFKNPETKFKINKNLSCNSKTHSLHN